MRRIMLAAALLLAAAARRAGADELSGSGYALSGGALEPGAELSAAAYGGNAGTVTGCGAAGDRTGGTDSGQCGAGGYSLLSHTQANTVVAANSAVTLSIPANAAPQDYDMIVNMDPLSSPSKVDPSRITQATAKLRAALGEAYSPAPQGIVELGMIQENDQFYGAALAAPGILRMKYLDANGDGIVDGTNPPIRARTLRIWALDEARGLWVRLPDSAVDQANRVVTATIPHFSVYALIGSADPSVDSVYAYPVPWSPNSGNPAANGTRAEGITFINVPSEGDIRIYNLAGELVRKLDIPATNTGKLSWDVKTPGGVDVVSGVYIWIVRSGSNKKTGKLMVVR